MTEINPAEAEYVNGLIAKLQEAADMAASEANESTRVLSTQLILIAGLALTVSSALMSNSQLVSKIKSPWDLILVVAWTLVLVSLLFGVLQLLLGRNFLRKWRIEHIRIARHLAEQQFSTLDEAQKYFVDEQDRLPKITVEWPLITQVILLALGFIMLLVEMSMIVFRH